MTSHFDDFENDPSYVTRFKWLKFYGHGDLRMAYGEDMGLGKPANFIVAQDVPKYVDGKIVEDDMSRRFLVFQQGIKKSHNLPGYDMFVFNFENLPRGEFDHLHEITDSGMEVFLWFDFESEEVPFPKFQETMEKYITRTVRKFYRSAKPDCLIFNWTNADRKGKFSRHLIVNNAVVESNEDVAEFYYLLKYMLEKGKKPTDFIDCLATKHKTLRMPYVHKFGDDSEEAVHKPDNPDTPLHLLLACGPNYVAKEERSKFCIPLGETSKKANKVLAPYREKLEAKKARVPLVGDDLPSPSEEELEDIRKKLMSLPAKWFTKKNNWYVAMMATMRVAGETGREIFREFSKQWDGYEKNEQARFDDHWERCEVYEDTVTLDDIMPKAVTKTYLHNSRKAFFNCVESMDVDKVREIVKDGVTKKSYFELLEYLNRFWAIIKGEKIMYAEKRAKNSVIEFVMRDKANFSCAFDNLIISVPIDEAEGKKKVATKSVEVTKLWLRSKFRLEFDRIVFNPRPDGHLKGATIMDFNLFRGFPIIDERETKVTPWIKHIENIWCKGNKEYYDYVIRWFAWCIQKPHEKTGVAIVVRGDQGTGKSSIVEPLKEIFGSYYKKTNDLDECLGDWNGILRDALLLVMEEAMWGGNKKALGKLKDMITADTHNIREKFKAMYDVENHTNNIFFSNESWVVPAEKTARRFFCLETDNRYAGIQTEEAKLYFEKIRSVSPYSIYKYLASVDLTDFNPRQFPMTEEFREQQELTLNPIDRWWVSLLKNDTEVDGLLKGRGVPKVLLYQNFINSHKGYQMPFWKNITKFTDIQGLTLNKNTTVRSIDEPNTIGEVGKTKAVKITCTNKEDSVMDLCRQKWRLIMNDPKFQFE